MVVQSVVMIDLVGYSDIAAKLEQALGVGATAKLNRDIQGLIRRAFTVSAAAASEKLIMTTGDGALLRFESADEALSLAASLQASSRAHNVGKTETLAKRVFRIGIGTGEIAIEPAAGDKPAVAGMPIVRAARLEAKAAPGEAIIDQATWEAASPALRAAYLGPHMIAGKRGESFVAFRAQLNPDGVGDAAHLVGTSSRAPPHRDRSPATHLIHEVRDGLRGLRKPQFDLLVLLMNVPIQRRPSNQLTLEEQGVGIMQWATDEDMLERLHEELGDMLRSPGR